MASCDFNRKTGKARLFFRFGGQQFNKTMPFGSDREARRVCGLVEETIQDLERGKLVMPPDADTVAFLVSGGKVVNRPRAVSDSFQEPQMAPSLKRVLDTYAETLTPGSKEANSIETEAVHRRHFVRLLGEDVAFVTLGLDTIQGYVDRQASRRVPA